MPGLLEALGNKINAIFRSIFTGAAKPFVWLLLPHRESVVVRNIPNAISTLRLLAAIPVAAWSATASPESQAGIVFWTVVVMVASDGFDGALARGLDVQSVYGERIDPLADKVMVVSLLVARCYHFGWDPILCLQVVVVTTIEALNTYYGMKLSTLAATVGMPGGASLWGKLKFGAECLWLYGLMSIADHKTALAFSMGMSAVVIFLAYMSYTSYRKRCRKCQTASPS